MWAGVAALAVLGGAGAAAVQWGAPDGEGGGGTATTEASSTQRAKPVPAPSASPSRAADPSESATGAAGSSAGDGPGPSGTPTIPATGPGTFVTASGGSAKVGTGQAMRYRVEVETGLDLDTADVAAQVERILADPRGWTADGGSAFQRVSGGSTDFVVKVATPGTVDRICLKYGGLDTGGEYNCSVNENVMVNLERWLLATKVYAEDVPSYRALIINHEVGHFLGHGHVTCPGPGKPAPAMMQQIKGMKGCVPNVWPYDDEGRPITGPAVP